MEVTRSTELTQFCPCCWNPPELFLLTTHCLFLLRLSAVARAQEDGRQSPAGGGAAAGEQDVPRSEQPAQGPRGPHLGQDHSQRHLLSSEAPGCTGHAVRCVCVPQPVLAGLTALLLHPRLSQAGIGPHVGLGNVSIHISHIHISTYISA